MSSSQSNEPKPPAESSPTVSPPTTPLTTAHTVLSLLAQLSSPRNSSADVSTQTSTLDAAQTVLSMLRQPSAQQGNSSDTLASVTPLSVAELAAGAALSELVSPPSPRENSSDAPTSVATAGAVKTLLSVLEQPLVSRITQASQPAPELPQEPSISVLEQPLASRATQASQPAPEPPREPSMNVPQPVAPESPQRGQEPTLRASSSAQSQSVRQTFTLPRETARDPQSYQAPHDAPSPPHRIPVPPASVYRRWGAPYPDSEATFNMGSRDPLLHHRGNTVAQRLFSTREAADSEMKKARYQAKWTNIVMNIAIGLQVFLGALTTGLGAALSGKKSASVAISVLGGASTLVASYLARAKGSNEPDFSRGRARQLKHFLREIDAFILDHEHEIGEKWDEKIKGFRLGLENMLGNHPGSVTINSEVGTNGGKDKGQGGMGPNTGLGVNGKNFVNATNAKFGPLV